MMTAPVNWLAMLAENKECRLFWQNTVAVDLDSVIRQNVVVTKLASVITTVIIGPSIV